MKKMGIVKEYNGQSGIIICEDNSYILKKDDLITKDIKVNDVVCFYESRMYFGNNTFLVARKIERNQ